VLKTYCVNACSDKWGAMEIAGQKAKHVERVLDVRQGELGWVVGTVYMDLPLKPNVLEDLARDVCLMPDNTDHSISLPLHPRGKSMLMKMGMYQLCLRMRVDG
jgi:DNA polymerase delta subunit 2